MPFYHDMFQKFKELNQNIIEVSNLGRRKPTQDPIKDMQDQQAFLSRISKQPSPTLRPVPGPMPTPPAEQFEEEPKLEYTPKDPALLVTGESVDTIIDRPEELEARAIKNNNPTNVRIEGRTEKFDKFDTPEEGVELAFSDLVNKLEGRGRITNDILNKHNIKEPTIGDLMLIHVIGDIDYNNKEGQKYLRDLKGNTGIPHWIPAKNFPKSERKRLLKGMMRNESIVFFKRHRNLVDDQH